MRFVTLNLHIPVNVTIYLPSPVSEKEVKRPAQPILCTRKSPFFGFGDNGCTIPISLWSDFIVSSKRDRYLGSNIFKGRREWGNNNALPSGNNEIVSGSEFNLYIKHI
jgi:hypothetical protein